MFLNANGLQFCVAVAGEGPNMLFLGGTGWDLRLTPTPMQSALVHHFTLGVIDQRGMGRTEKPPGPYSMVDYAQDAIAVLDKLGWDRAHLVGYSFGGMVAQEMAIRWPERINHLVLAASTPGGKGGSSYPVQNLLALAPYERARRGLEVADLRFSKAFQQENPEEAHNMITRRVATQTKFIEEAGARSGLAAQLAARAAHDTFDRLSRITAPTLVLSGTHDGQAPASYQTTMTERIPNARQQFLPGGHNFLFENTQCYAEIDRFCEDSD